MSNHHHRQIFSMGSCPPGPCASITKNTRQYTTDPQHTNSFVAINLRRHSLCQSWGIWISLVDKDSLLVGSVQPNAFQGVSQWTYCTQTAPETSVMWNSSFGSDLWQTYFSSLPYHQANTSELIPGDKILSINGYPISAFRNFEHITAYLRECLQLFLVVIRNNTAAARNALSTGVDITKRAILEDAHRIFQQIPLETNYSCPVPPVASVPRPVVPTASMPAQQLPKTVTPLKSEISNPHGHSSLTTNNKKSPIKRSMFTSTKKATTKKTRRPHPNNIPTVFKNPMFTNNNDGEPIPYIDNNYFDPYEGSRSKDYLTDIDASNFDRWLADRKRKWRSQCWNITSNSNQQQQPSSRDDKSLPTIWTNPMFTKPVKRMGSNGEETTESVPIPFADNYDLDIDDGNRIHQFLQPINSSNFSDWLNSRKRKWRSKWNVYEVEAASEEDDERFERSDCSVRVDFWRDRYPTFDQWLSSSLGKWKKGYSWNSRKRQKILQVCEEVVHFPSFNNPKIAKTQFRKWLRIRKGQWRVLRRKRQRLSAEESELVSPKGDSRQTTGNNIKGTVGSTMAHMTHRGLPSSEILCIDALLEEEELLQRSKRERTPLDISFLFFPSSGCPDDIAANILEYLDRMEYAKLLCVSKSTSEGLKSRSLMWQQLCPSRWTLPRRPRKPWHELYLSKLHTEVNLSRKQWDDLLSKISDILLKGDQLSVVKKLVLDAEKKFSFDVNYISGVVCERNSILNLAVIHQRHKIVHWLVSEKKADIETSDRGCFTPLLNAAWGGDKHLVRFLLQNGADRSKVGTGHYTEALAPSDFEGLNAEGWARMKGHDDIASLIRVGL